MFSFARLRRQSFLVALLLSIVLTITCLPAYAGTLSGIFHAPYGFDEQYATQPTERAPRDPMAGDAVWLHATTWPISPGQTTWVTWSVNGQIQEDKGFDWDYNSGNNTYWKLNLGSFQRGDVVSYTIHANVDGGDAMSTETFSFRVAGWSGPASVTAITDNISSLDLSVTDEISGLNPKIRLAFPAPDQVHIQVSPRGGDLSISGASYVFSQTDERAIITTSALTVVVNKNPYRIEIRKSDGTLITQQSDPASVVNTSWADNGNAVTRIADHWSTNSGERFEGFGERYDRLNQLGHSVVNYVYNQYRDQGSTGRTYLSVPFYTNSAGYGLFVNSTHTTEFDLGASDPSVASFSTFIGPQQTLDYFIFTGGPEEILDGYTAVTGRAKLPPKWAFGLWMSANEWNTQAEVSNELANVANYNIPHTAMVLEQWSDEATFYLWHGATYTPKPGDQALHYSDMNFPAGGEWIDPKAMVDAAHAQGIKMVLWQIPVLKQNFDTNPASAPEQHINDREHAINRGYVVTNEDGSPYRIPSGQWFGDSTVPDFTNAAATDWWMSKRAYLVDEIGIDGFKTDGGEVIFGRGSTFSDGSTGDSMHNAYPTTYTKAYSDFLDAHKPSESTLFSRSGSQGAQTTSIFWAGDQNSSFTGLNDALRAGLSAGSSGIPFWSWDMAGFTGDFPSSELYLRSAAMSVFTPIMQYHSEKSNPSVSEARTPWNVQERTGDTSVIPSFRKFASIRMSILPYLYTAAKTSSATGVPMMQTMGSAFPADPTAADLDQQYMFGPDLLVAPITTEGATSKDLYLPEGEWFDLWNGGAAQGGAWKNYYADKSTIPVYARAGAIIPLNLNRDYQLGGDMSNDLTYENLTFRIYPQGSSTSTYFDDAADTIRTITSTEDFANHKVTVNLPALGTAATLQVHSGRPSEITVGSTAVPEVSSIEALNTTPSGWFYDRASQFTYVKQPASPNSRTITISGTSKAAYEAEFAIGTGTATGTDHPGYTGTGFVDHFAEVGDSVEFQIRTAVDADFAIRIRYANAAGSPATRTVYVDGESVGVLTLPSEDSWDIWSTAQITAPLTAGKHTIKIQYEPSDTNGINLDNLAVTQP
ncbi:TIM-barrel domain-containing protein [Schaalia hyovaginalis]|uniref:TIM-barrel domain-containing protein n=1 Tax=Schaalia hyovaginalis TaxID=29316 RepID=UPI001F1FD6AD|nr:TIM-barrel domain-containing protein [Schaalia hyovaginalis]MCF2710993.1 carbohydrate-binding protein [Schaalia hyovaginalis]